MQGHTVAEGEKNADRMETVSYTHLFHACDCKISIKTRVGKDSPEEWENLLAIYEKYPLSEPVSYTHLDVYKRQRESMPPTWQEHGRRSLMDLQVCAVRMVC